MSDFSKLSLFDFLLFRSFFIDSSQILDIGDVNRKK